MHSTLPIPLDKKVKGKEACLSWFKKKKRHRLI